MNGTDLIHSKMQKKPDDIVKLVRNIVELAFQVFNS